MIAITGATGQLGQLVIQHLLARQVPASSLIAAVRSPAKATQLAALGVQLRAADYNQPASLDAAFKGVKTLLLISSNEIGRRAEQHLRVIEAARRQQVSLLVYTSLLHADRSPLSLAGEHRQTEDFLRASGLPFIILRNGWYTENYTVSIPAALANGAFYGSAGEGRISSAARSDYAEAAAAALTGKLAAGSTIELSGDTSYTLAELAAEISRQSGKAIPYVNIPEKAYADALLKAGLPTELAVGLASWDISASQGALFDDSKQLSRLIGHPTTSLNAAVKAALPKA